ncbi:hypothetical protein JCM8547_000082 [Rhodosporidiobolus lusitaniae]
MSLRNTTVGKGAREKREETVPLSLHSELLSRYSILERRRLEDRDRLRLLEALEMEKEGWEGVKEKLKGRVGELGGEVRELRQENKDLAAQLSSSQSALEDLQESIEHSLLDREIAESELEECQARVKELEERVGELEVEVEVGRGEMARLTAPIDDSADPSSSSTGTGEVDSLIVRQLTAQNARLKDALLRLRDLAHESETELKKKVEALEGELDLTSDLQGDLDNLVYELSSAESKIEDLKAQLDAAAEAGDMVEELMEREGRLADENELLKGDVEELEALRELADELEESHVETEKQLQEEIDLKDLHLQELRRRNDSLEDACADYEGTIGQFRELVLSLQADLDSLRALQASATAESATLSSQSQAMLNLNMKLQNSVTKGQVKAIELELRKLEARQAEVWKGVVKPYLLPSFFDSDSDAVDALLFFDRLAYKVDVVHSFVEQKHSVSEALDGKVPEELVGICETRAKLASLSSLSSRFSAHLKRCPPDVFLKMGKVYREVVGVEKRVDAVLEGLRREEFREGEVGREVEGFIAQLAHLAETHLSTLSPALDLFEREHGSITSLDLDFDTIAAAAGFTKQLVASVVTAKEGEREIEVEVGDGSLEEGVFKPLQSLVNAARNAKVLTKKLLRRFDELTASSSALNAEHAQGFETLAYNSSAIAGAIVKLASDISAYISSLRSSPLSSSSEPREPMRLSTLLSIAKEIAAVELGKAQSPRPIEEIHTLLGQLAGNLGTTLAGAMEGENVVKLEFEAPWVQRVAELQSNAAINVDAEKKVLKLNEEMRELVRDMRAKEQTYAESAVRIELMEKRMEGVKKQAEALQQLEQELAKSKKQERTYEEANEVLQRDLDKMEAELGQLRSSQKEVENQGSSTTTSSGADPSVYEGNLETSFLIDQITSLRSALRFLRSENSYLKSQDLLSTLDALPSYSLPPTPPLTPEPCSTDEDGDDGPLSSRSLLPPSPFRLPPEAFKTQSKLLLREARLLSATPRLVDVSHVAASALREGGGAGMTRKAWQPAKRDPKNQLWAEKQRAWQLQKKLEQLMMSKPTDRPWMGVTV